MLGLAIERAVSAAWSFLAAPWAEECAPPAEAHQEELEALRRAWVLGQIQWELVLSPR
jgi:hypothetical protein